MVTNTIRKTIVWALTLTMMFTMGFGTTMQSVYAANDTNPNSNIQEESADTSTQAEDASKDVLENENADEESYSAELDEEEMLEGETEESSSAVSNEFEKQDELAYNFLWIQNHGQMTR